MTRKLVSIDLETLDVLESAVILSIGIVVGDSQGNVSEKFHIFPNIQQQIAAGRTISGDTIMWWLGQDEDARLEQMKSKRFGYKEAIDETLLFLERHSDASLYLGNAPSFDCDMLANFLGTKPWKFYQERDVRTARMIIPEKARAVPHLAHSALADAEAQYLDFVWFFKLENFFNDQGKSA